MYIWEAGRSIGIVRERIWEAGGPLGGSRRGGRGGGRAGGRGGHDSPPADSDGRAGGRVGGAGGLPLIVGVAWL